MSNTYPTVYHCARCSCGSNEGEKSVDEFLAECFFPRQNNQKDLIERTLDGIRSKISQQPRCEFIDDRYKGSDIDDQERRHPILCADAHYSWTDGNEKNPSSMQISGLPNINTLMKMIKEGESVDGVHFKHMTREKEKCYCQEGNDFGKEDRLKIQKEDAMKGIKDGLWCIAGEKGKYSKWELRYFLTKDKEGYAPGSYEENEIQNLSIQFNNYDKIVSFWMMTSGRGDIPHDHASYFADNSPDISSKKFLKIPPDGTLILIIPKNSFKEYKNKLNYLKNNTEKIDIGVKLVSSKRNKSLPKLGEEYYCGIIEWNSSSLSILKKFLIEITGLESQNIRSSKPLKIDLFDREYTALVPKSKDDLTKYQRPEIGHNFNIRISRLGNKLLDTFYLRLEKSIKLSMVIDKTSNSSKIQIKDMGFDRNSGEYLFRFFCLRPISELWLTLEVERINGEPWFEVFNHKESVDSSGMKIKICEAT